jgi:mRNA interferase RelE/StbE
MFKVVVHRQVARYLKKLSESQREKIKEVLRELEKEPFQKSDVKHMLGEWKGYHRIRVGNIRIIFWIDQKENIIYVDHIGPRGDVYK